MKPSVGARSDVGKVREGNEDAYLVQDPLYAVADGMGGHLAGDIASSTAIDTIRGRAAEGMPRDGSDLAALIEAANEAIWEKASSDPGLRGMGTTCTLVYLDGSTLHVGHVGDSRAYLFRDGDLTQITEDHTLVGRMVKEGRLRPEDAERHPQRSIITRALGVDARVAVDVSDVELVEGDRVLLCSDGLTSMLDGDQIEEVLRRERDPQASVDRLVELANEAGGEDNITAVLLSFDGSGGAAATNVPAAPRRRTDPGSEPTRAPVEARTAGPRWARLVISTLLTVGILVVAAYLVMRYVVLPNSFYVGVDGNQRLAIFQGFPEDVGGFEFSEETGEASEISVDDLPEFLQADVREGIKAESLEDARATIENLEARAQDPEFERQDERRDRTNDDRQRRDRGGN